MYKHILTHNRRLARLREMRGGDQSRQGGLAQSHDVQSGTQMLHHLHDVGDASLEIEGTLVEGDVARIDPIGDEDLKAGEKSDDKVAQQDRKVTG